VRPNQRRIYEAGTNMARNDVVLLDAVIDQRMATEAPADRSEVFELFVLEQVLKEFDLSREQVEEGWTDGSSDGGIDGFYTLVKGRSIDDPEGFAWPRIGAEVDVFLVTCKHSDSFQQAPLDALLASFQELFDLTRVDLSGNYSSAILQARTLFQTVFRQLSIRLPTFRFHVVYACRGSTDKLGQSITARGAQIEALFLDLFSGCTCDFEPLGAAELVGLSRRVNRFELNLPFVEHLSADGGGHVVLVRLSDYARFVTAESGSLRRYLFDSNVRDFLGRNPVNQDIAATLANAESPDFWWMNNGVTILATRAALVGKEMQLQEIQIINGLQTTESIFRHFAALGDDPSDMRSILVKVLVSGDKAIRDAIIRATNNQSAVESAALHATDKIQRDIEDVLLKQGWFYERRTNFYRNAGAPEARIVPPLFVAAASAALLLRNPVLSGRMKQRHLRSDAAYEAVFGEHFPLEAWPVVVECLRRSEMIISLDKPRASLGRVLGNWRGVLAYAAMTSHLRSLRYTDADLCNIRSSDMTDDHIAACWQVVKVRIRGTLKPASELVHSLCLALAEQYSITGSPTDRRRNLPEVENDQVVRLSEIAPQVIDRINSHLPPQPWKPGIHVEIARTLGLPPNVVSKAISKLTRSGKRYVQRHGIVYSHDGRVIMVDHARTDVDREAQAAAIAELDSGAPSSQCSRRP
jgi:hypothetical protein